ncbi:AAA family ATPase [Streptomyces roseirectus]|uniref:AAA family ATPase n=1 Tax=Streptomyces roseirectus TaxID=2768066 RepID=A0A7H0IEV9_9ACTN|nr:AAA family ATPase [Streptomyces roseirectus]QNP71325.1 AAA family ATPase [Streptomyces roseirectus]
MADELELEASLRHERAHHDRCRTAFAAMVDGADEQVVVGEDVSASGADAEVLGYQLRSHAKALRELPEGPLFFGRLDFEDGRAHYVGRVRVSERPADPPLVVDWRAPVSRAFYQASVRDPQGVDVRRRFGWAPGSRGESGDLTGLEDERLGVLRVSRGEAGAGGVGGGGAGLGEAGVGETGVGEAGVGEAGPGDLLTRELERPRVGPMRDIAATIQPEQDDLVRAGLGDSVCVQGAPGTGKTAVGLHRAAYLLYTYPRRIERAGLLILGPNRTFLAYISEVLPALGETGVRQSTLTELVGRHPVTGTDPRATAVVKHDPRMAEVLRRALYGRVRADDAEGAVVQEGSYRWRVPAGEVAEIVRGVLDEAPPYEVGRERVRTRIVVRMREQAERRSGTRNGSWVRRVERAVGGCVDAVWPKARAEEVVYELLRGGPELADLADGLLSAEEQADLVWARPPRSWKSARWSAADLVLLDEVSGLIAHPAGYGHIVVDEAQDLSPMECRAIARRAEFGSLTVLGDLAQGTTAWAARSWSGQLCHLGKPEAAVVPLTVGFRVPAVVLELANRVRGRLEVSVPAARSLRGGGEVRVTRCEGDLYAGVLEAVRRALKEEGSVGVVVADAELPLFQGVSGERVEVVAAGVVKGLEYDHVVVVEPAAIVEGEERGWHRLYVVLTRAVSRLEVVHGRELPW